MPKIDRDELDSASFIRTRMFQEEGSDLDKYQALVTGETGRLALVRYELLMGFVALIPGGAGLVLRRYLYRSIFRKMGRGVVIGRNVVIRHADKISLGDRVVIDDDCVIDGRGAGDSGIQIGDDVIINRGCTVQSKQGEIVIGAKSSIGAHSVVVSMGGVTIDESVLIAGGCYISGGMYHNESLTRPINEQGVYSDGPVEIGRGSWFGMGAIVLDAVRVGQGVIVGAGAVVARDLPDFVIASGVPAQVRRTRKAGEEDKQRQ